MIGHHHANLNPNAPFHHANSPSTFPTPNKTAGGLKRILVVLHLTHSLTHSIPSESAELLRSTRDREKNSIIMLLNKIAQKSVHGTTIVPHDGQQSSMMNEKHVQKKPGVDHPIASVDDLGAYEVAHGSFFHTNSQVAILNKELANDSLYMRSLPQNGICRSESSQAMISLDKFDMRSAVFDSFLTSHHASHH